MILSAVDINQKKVEVNLQIWVSDTENYLRNYNDDGIRITLDKKEYKAGEKAILSISTDKTPRDALLINGRNFENSHQVINLNTNLTQIEIPVLESDLPNTNIQVKSFNNDSLDKDFVMLNINTDNRKLDLVIKSDKQKYQPSETVNLEIETKNNNQPISTELSLGVVDKAIYELKNPSSNESGLGILNSFYYTRYFGIPESDSLEPIYSETRTGGGGGGGGVDSTRSNFKDTAFWKGEIKTDKDGKAKISFKLPDNLTTWVINTTGIANEVTPKVGFSQIEIKTTKPISLYPVLPNLIRLSDEITISSVILNDDDKDHIFDVSLLAKDFDISSTSSPTISVKAKSSQEVFWTIKPKNLNPEAILQFKAVAQGSPKLADTIESKLEIIPFEFKEESYNSRDIPSSFDLKLNSDSDINKSSIKLNISSTIVGSLPTAMDYLIGYPYGCSEQTTSKLAPLIIAKQNPTLFPNALKEQNTNKIIETSLENLARLRNEDGGFGFWNDGVSDPFISAYVAEYLSQALVLRPDLKAPFLTDTRLDVYFRNQIQSENVQNQVASLYGLSVMDPLIFDLGDSVAQEYKNKLDSGALNQLSDDLLAMAVMANYKNGNTDPKVNGLDILINRAKIQGESIYWNAGNSKNFGSRTASTAMAVKAMLTAGGDRVLVAKGVKNIESNRKNGYWGNTFSTSWSILALTEFAKSGKELNPNYNYEIFLDDKKIASGTMNKPYQNEQINLDLKQIKSTGSKLEIRQIGEGQIYSTLKTQEFRTDPDTDPVSNGIKINKEYQNIRGENTNFKVGDIVKVKFSISGLSDIGNYALIEDELPAGMVPVNSNLDNEKFTNANDDRYYQSPTNIIYTKNGALINANLVTGNNQVSYFARVVSNGSFSVPPSKVSLMYSPEINATTKSSIFKSDNDGFKQTNFIPQINQIPVLISDVNLPKTEQPIQTQLPTDLDSNQDRISATILVFILSALLILIFGLLALIFYINKKTKITSFKDLTNSLSFEFNQFYSNIKNKITKSKKNDQVTNLVKDDEVKITVEKTQDAPPLHSTENDILNISEKTDLSITSQAKTKIESETKKLKSLPIPKIKSLSQIKKEKNNNR